MLLVGKIFKEVSKFDKANFKRFFEIHLEKETIQFAVNNHGYRDFNIWDGAKYQMFGLNPSQKADSSLKQKILIIRLKKTDAQPFLTYCKKAEILPMAKMRVMKIMPNGALVDFSVVTLKKVVVSDYTPKLFGDLCEVEFMFEEADAKFGNVGIGKDEARLIKSVFSKL